MVRVHHASTIIMSKSNGEEEADELEQRLEFLGDSEYEASSSSTVTTGSSAQFRKEPKKRPMNSCTFHLKSNKFTWATVSRKFHPESNKFTWATVSRKVPIYTRCTVCNRDFSVAYRGTKDLRKHEQTYIHQAVKKTQSGATSLTSYFSSVRGPTREQSVIEAEIKFGYFLGEHHIPLCVADHCAKLVVSTFPDSAIAKLFKCGWKKVIVIVEVVV